MRERRRPRLRRWPGASARRSRSCRVRRRDSRRSAPRHRLTARSSPSGWSTLIPAPQIYRGAAALKVTSGSTGLPKATFTRESQLVADTVHITTAMDIGPDDCQIAAIPISHAYGLGNLVMPLLLQGTAIVLREAFIPQQLHADATTYGARVFQACRSCLRTLRTIRTRSPGRACSRRSSAPARRSIPSWRVRSLEPSA